MTGTTEPLSAAFAGARFRYKATIEQLEYSQERGLDKNTVHRLADGEFIKAKENVPITGPTGTGKSFLASAIGNQACLQGYKVLYANTTRLLTQLKMAKADGSSIKELMKIERQDLLILDDFGIQPFDSQSRASLLEITKRPAWKTIHHHYLSITDKTMVRCDRRKNSCGCCP